MVDTTAQEVEQKGTTRFINEHYYYQPYENGGIADDSVWKTDQEYTSIMKEAFRNLSKGTAIETYAFTREEIVEMKKYILKSDIWSTEEALQNFYDQYIKAGLQKEK